MAKVSKNDFSTRKKVELKKLNGKSVKPTLVQTAKYKIIGAEYVESGELVMGQNSMPVAFASIPN